MRNSPFSFLIRYKATILLGIGFLTGLAIFLYPVISQYYADHYHTRVIDSYQEALDDMLAEDLRAQQQQLESYNASLSGSSVEVTDPFSSSAENEVSAESFTDSFNVFSQYLGDTIGYIDIPTIDAYLPIYAGTSEEVLQKGIGLLEETSYPIGGTSTHSVLTGHRGLPTSTLFTDLPDVEIGDVFYLHVLGETLAYEVEEKLTVLPHETEHITIEDGEDLVTLITCTPYMLNTHRLLVRGTRISYEEEAAATGETAAPLHDTTSPRIPGEILLVIAGGTAVTAFSLFRRKRNKKKGGRC